MNDKAKIKIVKKNTATASKPVKKKAAKPRAAAREMVSTVTGWVSELKNRQTASTSAAIEKLFGKGPQPSES